MGGGTASASGFLGRKLLWGPAVSGSATHTGTHASGKKVSAVSGSGGLAAAGQVPIAGGSGALTAGQSGSTASTFYGNNVATASQGGTASASGFLGRKLLWGPAVSGSVALGKSKSYGTVGLGTMTAAGNTASGAADLPAGFTTAGIKTDSGVEGTAYGKLYHGNSVSSTSSVAGTLQGPFLNSASGSA